MVKQSATRGTVALERKVMPGTDLVEGLGAAVPISPAGADLDRGKSALIEKRKHFPLLSEAIRNSKERRNSVLSATQRDQWQKHSRRMADVFHGV
jgi:hypothetical protein